MAFEPTLCIVLDPITMFSILMEPAVGLEPTTYGLQNRCSTG